MPPTPPNPTPSAVSAAPAKVDEKPRQQWSKVAHGASTRAKIITFLVALALTCAGVGFLIGHLIKPTAQSNNQTSATVQNLSPDEISQLGQLGTSLGSKGQTLTVGADSIFKGRVDVGGDLNLNGHLNANGPVSLQNINSSGSSNFGVVTIGQGLNVGGAATVQGGINAQNFLNVNGSLNVNGNASLGAVTASALTVKNLTVLGPLAVAHLVSSGPTPGIAGGTLGSGGTANISGNDTSGLINLNTGSGPGSGLLATVTFKAGYGGRPHVVLMPSSSAAANTPVYVQPSPGGFSIVATSTPPAGQTLSFDYIVVQ